MAGRRVFWNLYAAGFPSPAFDRSVGVSLRGIDRCSNGLHTALIAITRRCALACEHCVEGDSLNLPEALSLDQLREIVRRVLAQGAAQIFFSGGEPMQRFADLESLISQTSATADAWIVTSGLGLTSARARRLSEAGATGVMISLDHWRADAHDCFRGTPGSFDAACLAAANARSKGLLVALSICATRTFVTADNLQRYAETAHALGASFIQVLEPRSAGRYAGQDVALEPDQQRLLEAFSDRLNFDPGAADFPAVRYQDWHARVQGCHGGNQYVYIDTSGTLHACPFCRTSGVRLLERDAAASFSHLRTQGCPAGSQCASSTGVLP